MKKRLEKQKGITLIALVVTIIVLLILAGVSINLILGENGIINQANRAKTEDESAQEKEQVELIAVAAYMATNGERVTKENLINELNKTVGNDKYSLLENTKNDNDGKGEYYSLKYIESGKKYKVYVNGTVEVATDTEEIIVKKPIIPDGYYLVEGTEETGYVISDNVEDKDKGLAGTLVGKIYKWIIANDANSYSKNTNIAKSVRNYGGYYIDIRYENSERINEEYAYTDIYEDKEGEDIAICKRTGMWSLDDLSYFRDDVDAGYNYEGVTVRLMADIDLSSKYSAEKESWNPIGNSIAINVPEQDFCGIFDGNNHVIKKLYTNVTDDRGAALFARNRGTIKNLILEDCDINNTYDVNSGNMYIGGIVAVNYGTIEKCGIKSGNIVGNAQNTSENSNSYVGGITGYNYSGGAIVSQCYNRANITANTESTFKKYAYAGGIVGLNYSTIEYCYNTGEIYSEGYYSCAGGIAGVTSNDGSSIEYCYNVGNVSGTNSNDYCHIGEIAANYGTTTQSSNVSNSYGTTNTDYLYWRYESNWIGEAGTDARYQNDDFKSNASIPGVILTSALVEGKQIFKEDYENNSINNGYLILNWE